MIEFTPLKKNEGMLKFLNARYYINKETGYYSC